MKINEKLVHQYWAYLHYYYQPMLQLISPIQFLSPTLTTQPTMFFPEGPNFQPSPRLARLSSSDMLSTA